MLLIAWVGVIALMRGITEIIFAFKLRSTQKCHRRVAREVSGQDRALPLGPIIRTR